MLMRSNSKVFFLPQALWGMQVWLGSSSQHTQHGSVQDVRTALSVARVFIAVCSAPPLCQPHTGAA